MSAVPSRLAAPERRRALIDTALQVFSEGSYRGTTTAEIARESGVTEPVLYRHFASKRDLYLACLEEAWARLRTAWEQAIEQEPDPAAWLPRMGSIFMELQRAKVLLSNLWLQGLTEASEDPVIRSAMRRHLKEVHGFVVGVIERAQASGHVVADRDPTAEAWIFISLGLLGSIGRRLGGLAKDDFPRITASRREWMTGAKSEPPA